MLNVIVAPGVLTWGSYKRNGPSRVLCEHEEFLLVHLVLTNPGIYLRELQEELYSITMQWVHESTICRTLHRIGMSYQQIKRYSLSRSEQKRADFWAEFTHYEPNMILWVDETGFELRNAFRKQGYAIRGLPPQDYVLELRGKRYSSIGILTTDGIEDVYIAETSVNGEVFLDFVRKCLLPLLLPFDGNNEKSIVVLDNASIHHVNCVVDTIRSVGSLVRFLPPYSPDINPIEEVFAEVKHWISTNSILCQSTNPRSTILMAFSSVSKQNCISYVNHSGYVM